MEEVEAHLTTVTEEAQTMLVDDVVRNLEDAEAQIMVVVAVVEALIMDEKALHVDSLKLKIVLTADPEVVNAIELQQVHILFSFLSVHFDNCND